MQCGGSSGAGPRFSFVCWNPVSCRQCPFIGSRLLLQVVLGSQVQVNVLVLERQDAI